MITISTFQNWWRFFHRYSLAHREKNFDRIVFLSLKTLNCPSCQEDATEQYQILVNHQPPLEPFEKLVRLHNYVNTKLKKPVYTTEQVMEEVKDILLSDNQIDYGKLLTYYFDWLFATSESCAWTSLMDLKELSSLIADSFMQLVHTAQNSKALHSNPIMIQVNPRITSRPTVFLKTYDYYQNLNKTLPHTGLALKSYHQVYPHANTKAARKPCLRCQQSKQARERLLEARKAYQAKLASMTVDKNALSRTAKNRVIEPPLPAPTPPAPAPQKSPPVSIQPPVEKQLNKVHPPRPPIPTTYTTNNTNTQPVTVPKPQNVHTVPPQTKVTEVQIPAQQTSVSVSSRAQIHRNNPYLPELRALRRTQQTHFRIIKQGAKKATTTKRNTSNKRTSNSNNTRSNTGIKSRQNSQKRR